MKQRVEGKAEWMIRLGLTFKSQIGFSYISKVKIFSVFGHMWELPSGDLSLKKVRHQPFAQLLLEMAPDHPEINIDRVHF